MKLRLAAILVLALLGAGPLPPARSASGYDGCAGFIDALPAVVSTQGVWCLRHDLSTNLASGAAINIAANNVSIDCNDFKVGGLAAGDASQARGIRAGGRQNVLVRNCGIRGFQHGIDLQGGGGHLVEDNRLDNNLVAGITLDHASSSLVRRNRVFDTGGYPDDTPRYGIYCDAETGSACDVRDNIVSGVVGTDLYSNMVYGIRLSGGQGSRAAGNQVGGLLPLKVDKTAHGIDASGSTGVVLDGNRVSMAAAIPNSVGLRCQADGGAMRENATLGFATAASGCLDDGGNVAH